MTRVKKEYLFLFFFVFIASFYGEPLLIANYEGEEYLAFAEQMPEPVGGLPAIYKLIKYPEFAKKANIEGKVYVLAFINEDGGVDDVKVIKGIGGGCDEAAVEAIKTSKFVPGKSEGKIAKIKMSLQIQFKLK